MTIRRLAAKLLVYLAGGAGVAAAAGASQLVHPYAAYRFLEDRAHASLSDIVAFGEMGFWAALLAYVCAKGIIRLFRFDWMLEETRLWSSNVEIGIQGGAGLMSILSGVYSLTHSMHLRGSIETCFGAGLILVALLRNRIFKEKHCISEADS